VRKLFDVYSNLSLNNASYSKPLSLSVNDRWIAGFLFGFIHSAFVHFIMKGFLMFRKIAMVATCGVVFVFTGSITQAQFGGVQVQVGGYGSGLRVGNFGYGNGYYGGYGGGFGNQYYGNQYYGNRYTSGYGGYSTYGNRGYFGNGITYNGYSGLNRQYVAPRVYASPLRRSVVRRFGYR